VKRYGHRNSVPANNRNGVPATDRIPYDPFSYQRRETFVIDNMGGKHVPVVIADLSKIEKINPQHLQSIGYTYDVATDKWNISDAAADYVFTGKQLLDFKLPGTLKVIVGPDTWNLAPDKAKYFPIFSDFHYSKAVSKSERLNFVMVDCFSNSTELYDDSIINDPTVVICLSSTNQNAMQSVRRMFMELMSNGIKNPVVLITDSAWKTPDEHLIHFATETGALFLEGMGDGICLGYNTESKLENIKVTGKTYLDVKDIYEFTNNTAFSILQATRTRISKTEYISCPQLRSYLI
jgi:(E)-4-hydroxy-3-methylbut-2-enyl-diphosphate synthase